MDKELIKLIEDNGLTLHGDIEFFAYLVAEREREACAKVCDSRPLPVLHGCEDLEARACAAAIRARSEA